MLLIFFVESNIPSYVMFGMNLSVINLISIDNFLTNVTFFNKLDV